MKEVPLSMLQIFYGILLPFFGTTLGAACVFFMKKTLDDMVQCALQGFAAGVMVALLLLFSIPNLDFTSLHQDTSSQTDRILPEHENGRLYQFTRELGQNIGDGTSSLIKYVSDFSSKLMNGGK